MGHIKLGSAAISRRSPAFMRTIRQRISGTSSIVWSAAREELHAPIEEGHISAGLMHLANASYRLGRTIHFDPEKQEAIGDAEANAMLRDEPRGYRKPFAVPEKV